MRKIYFYSNGCEQRNLDMEYFIQLSMRNGDLQVNDVAEADIALIVTCCVSNFAEEHSIDYINMCCDAGVKTIAYGCLPGIKKDWLLEIGIECYCVNQRADFLKAMDWKERIQYPCLTEADEACVSMAGKTPREEFEAAKSGKKIIISEGCLNQCSYCVIRYATGTLVSRPASDIIEEWNSIIVPGDCAMLMGGDTGAYGMDIRSNLPSLLKKINKQSVKAPIYLHDLNIRWMKTYLDEFCDLFREDVSIRGMTLPIQSGSNRILDSMNRHYTAEDIRYCFSMIHEKNPNIILGTHVIIGYPGETDKDFWETADILKHLPIDFISCFAYSEHKKAASAQIFPKVSHNEIQRRVKVMKELFVNKIKVFH